MVETRSGKMQDPAQERIQAEESAKPQPGATIGRDASSDPVVLNPNIDIPKYDGTEDPRPWIESLEEIGFLYHWADYIISRYAAMNMTGSAKTWLNLHKASFTSWENIKIRLIQDFSLDANKEELRMKLNRMQHWNEPAIRFAEDILVLCNKVDPAMEEETKIEHVIGGLKKEYSFALYLNPPKTTDDLLVVCKKMDYFEKKYRERVEKSRNLYNGPRYSRPQQQSRYVPPTAERNYQTTSRPQAPVSNNYKNDSPPTPRQYRNNFPQPSTPRRPYNPNFVPKPNLQRNTYNKSQEVSKNRTEDGRPICFKCNKPGHVARYCRVKFIRILEEDPADTQEKIFRVGRFKLSVAPESVNQSKSTINGIKKLDPKYKLKINVDKIGTFEALVDTGADLSVVDLRTALDTGHGISKLAKICAGPDGKKLDMVGSIFLNIKIDDETLSHNFVILKTHLRTLILGRDFLKKMNAKIDCKQETIKYDLTNNHDEINFEMLKIKSAKDSIVPDCSMILIKALVETEDGEYIIEESSKMFQTNGLRLARSLINVINRETHIWITNPYPRPLKIMKNQTLAFGSSPAKINVSREREVEKNEEPRFQINENLSPKEQKELKQVLERYGDLFSSRLGRTNLAKHRIDTEDAKPIKHKPYRVSAKERDIIKEQIDEMLTEGIIRPSSSPWSFPVILVKKRDGKYRFCVDYRKLNNVTVKDVYPIPRIDEVMDTLQGSTHFSAIDLRSGYWQVEVEERDKEKTAFTTAHGLYEFNVMPFGLCNAPATFERNMENMLGNLRWQICLCYLDDVIIYSPDFPTHLKRLEAVFRCFRESNLRLNDKKCRFAFEELEILGYITSKHGIKPAEHNIKAVRNFPRPKKVKEVQSFLGMCSYYRKFIKDFSKIADPLTNLIKKSVSFTWTERQEKAFQTLKTALLSPPILGHFNPNAPTYVHTDASNIGIGATLVQDIGGEEKVISYLSRTLSKAEQNYSTTEKECLAVVWSMSKLRPYLYGRHFKIVTDHHALCWLKNLKDPTGRLARWALKIQEYDFDIIHKSGKKHLDADGLSRGPLPETDWDEDFERLFLNQITDEEDKFIESVKKNLNGSRRSIAQNFKEEDGCLFKKNPNPEGRAWLLVVPENKKREIMKEYHNHMSNGHLGVARTMYRIKSKYFWPSMLKDVSEFVKTCHLCQSRKGSNQLPSGLLQPIPPANFPFERIGIDFVGPLPSTKNRKKWIIVLSDYYTRYAETRAVSEATVKEVSKFLVEDIFLRHGAPQYLISDRGSQFTSNLMKEVMKTCKIKHCFTTSYHPQTNGLTERLNRTLINMLSMYVNTDQKNWDEILPFITHAYNTTIQETTGYSPFFLMFGREPTSLLDDRNISVDIDKDDYDEYIKHHLDKINRTRKLVINNTIKTQERMKKNYDKKHTERSYEPGELVAVWTPIRKIGKCEKLLRKYFGPYRILKKLSNVNYLIEPKYNPGQDPLIVHVSRIKPYFERIDEVNHEDLMALMLMVNKQNDIVVETPGNETVTRRSRRLQGLQPEHSTVLAFPARKKMEREENRPFCHRWRDPTVFSGERGEDSQRWLSDFQRVARYNKWDDSMCLANVIFYLTGTAKCWFESYEEILNSWEEFKIKFCEIFGNKEDTARKAENILRTRAQTSGENVESYIQEVLLLCKQSNPRMSEGEKVSHLIKGVAEEVYQALIGKDIGTVDQFVAFCRRFEAFKRMRVAPPRFSRLPNVTTISTAEPENLEALIRRIVREEVQKFMAPPSTFAAQDIDTPPPDLRDVIRSEIQQTLAPISAPRQPESFRPRRQYLPQNDQVYRRRTEGPPNNQRTQWRTEDDRPICFHCGRPGHVARYCRDRRQAFTDARLGRETVDFGRPRTENYTMGESGSELSQGRFRNPSPYPLPRGRFQAPRRTSQSPARRPSRSPSRRRRNVQALVDSGADYSVISEAFRRSIKAPVFKENGPLLKAADKKPIVTLGKCSLEVQIKGLDIIFDFVVAAECSHDVILGWDFFKATDAIIDCGEDKLYLSEAEKSYEWKDLKLCAAMDCVTPPRSFGKIVVTNQDVFGSRDVVVTGSKRLQLEKGLFIPSSLVRFLHGRAVLWVTNSTHQSQVIPSDMKIGTMQDLEVGSISNLDACSEIAGKDEVTSPDVRECLISMISTDLEETKKNRLLTCLNEFSDIFDFEKKIFPVSGEIKHKIDTSDYPPVRQRPYRVSPAERRVIQSEVEKMMETKIIRPSSSPWASPVILVRKKDGSLRFCVDYRRLNKITKKDVYPLPCIDDALDTLSGSRYFSTMDMRSGYWQIEVDDKDREKTAFITPDGLYEFNVMPFGLCNAPATSERMIDNVLRGLKWDMCLCYLDDIVVYGSIFKEHLTRLYKVLRCIQQAGLCLNYKKCHFASRQITILGHVVNEFGTQPDPEKVKAIVHFPKPRNISETRSFLGLSSYYRRFIKSYANKSRPLNSLLKKDEKFIWGVEQDESFRILKQELGSSPVLGHFIEGAETHVHTDASGYGLGAVLVQIQNDAERPIAYASRTLTKAEKNYSTTEKECLAVVWALGKFRPYLYGRPFTVVTDHHSLCWLVGLKDPFGRLARWALKLQEYDIDIVYKSGRKHKDADCLSRSPLADTAEIEGHITSIQDIAEEQSKDPHLVGIREKLANENLKGYQMIGGVLYKKNYDPEGKPWLLVVPKQMRHEILKDVHDTPMAGHLGFAKTYDRVRKRFYWPGLYRTVSQYIAHCKECQRRKGVPQKPPGLLVPIPPTTSPFQKIGIDYLGRFPISHTGNRWIIVATDYLTRFAITKAAATAEATELATFLIEDVILKHGAPREIITDRGRNFMSQTIREINNLNRTIHRFTTPAETAEDYVGHLVTNAEDARMLARLNILQAQSKDKERYDKKHQEVTYKEGDLVWVFTPVRTVGLSEKLLKRYFGPYRVIRKISSVNYQVEGVTNTRRRRKTQDIVHVVRMKPYHDPEVQEQIAQGHVTD
ncbi:hypothetical protein LAZ67_9001970 [Cordylochernes scorpioides]|uniref:RNA-directed DNA polymerase n=1 Tax=Cordylochernes scorpioides TaxID=51811 RepID=A0ABY6KTI1_9ARAC|nr:hypothetical protein LAZ67_9001970 [Cordylochernes scorpioides]